MLEYNFLYETLSNSLKKIENYCYLLTTFTQTCNLLKNNSNKFYKNLILAYYNGKLIINIIVFYYINYY